MVGGISITRRSRARMRAARCRLASASRSVTRLRRRDAALPVGPPAVSPVAGLGASPGCPGGCAWTDPHRASVSWPGRGGGGWRGHPCQARRRRGGIPSRGRRARRPDPSMACAASIGFMAATVAMASESRAARLSGVSGSGAGKAERRDPSVWDATGGKGWGGVLRCAWSASGHDVRLVHGGYRE